MPDFIISWHAELNWDNWMFSAIICSNTQLLLASLNVTAFVSENAATTLSLTNLKSKNLTKIMRINTFLID